MSASFENKTIRPGSLVGYNYYHSDRHRSTGYSRPTAPKAVRVRQPHPLAKKLALTAAVLTALIVLPLLRHDAPPTSGPLNSGQTSQKAAPAAITPAVAVPEKVVNHCANNTLGKFILVSVSQRHLWACEGSKTVHDAPVITGMLAQPDTLTPPGTYHIYAKQTNTTLKGADSTGSWSRPVHYWMPFLDNQHGTYGFHDATWRTDNEFGTVDPASSSASHGCVELPLASQQWLYDWAPLKTALTVEV